MLSRPLRTDNKNNEELASQTPNKGFPGSVVIKEQNDVPDGPNSSTRPLEYW